MNQVALLRKKPEAKPLDKKWMNVFKEDKSAKFFSSKIQKVTKTGQVHIMFNTEMTDTNLGV